MSLSTQSTSAVSLKVWCTTQRSSASTAADWTCGAAAKAAWSGAPRSVRLRLRPRGALASLASGWGAPCPPAHCCAYEGASSISATAPTHWHISSLVRLVAFIWSGSGESLVLHSRGRRSHVLDSHPWCVGDLTGVTLGCMTGTDLTGTELVEDCTRKAASFPTWPLISSRPTSSVPVSSFR